MNRCEWICGLLESAAEELRGQWPAMYDGTGPHGRAHSEADECIAAAAWLRKTCTDGVKLAYYIRLGNTGLDERVCDELERLIESFPEQPAE